MSTARPPRTEGPSSRPRVVGAREQEILAATLGVLEEVGYDRLTMDAVAAAARASKATLYRRWAGKADLVVDALRALRGPVVVPDTGTLRGDLLAMWCGPQGLDDKRATGTFAAVMTAMATDAEFAEVFRREVVADKLAASHAVFARAQERGEVRADADLELLEPALAAIVLHRAHVLGEPPTPDLVTRVVDQVVLPAALADPRTHLRAHLRPTAGHQPATGLDHDAPHPAPQREDTTP